MCKLQDAVGFGDSAGTQIKNVARVLDNNRLDSVFCLKHIKPLAWLQCCKPVGSMMSLPTLSSVSLFPAASWLKQFATCSQGSGKRFPSAVCLISNCISGQTSPRQCGYPKKAHHSHFDDETLLPWLRVVLWLNLENEA